MDHAGSSLSIRLIRQLSSSYIRLFDTLPIATNEEVVEPANWRRLLLARKLASHFLERGIQSVRQIDMYREFRQMHFTSNPEWFGC